MGLGGGEGKVFQNSGVLSINRYSVVYFVVFCGCWVGSRVSGPRLG